MLFYLGVHRPAWLAEAGVPLFVSHSVLRGMKKLPRAIARWALDSGAYTEIVKHGGWRTSAREYAHAVARYRQEIGRMDWAAPQDWTCDEDSLAKTGRGVRFHQERTIESYLELKALGVPVIPVLQGHASYEYRDHVELYEQAGVRLSRLPIVGVGSLVKRQETLPTSLLLKGLAQDGLRIHAFGVKKKGLTLYADALASADSSAWSFEATKHPPLPGHAHAACSNCLEYALIWREEILDTIRRQGVRVENGEKSPAPSRASVRECEPCAAPPKRAAPRAGQKPVTTKERRVEAFRSSARSGAGGRIVTADEIVRAALRKAGLE